ncbi:MAG: exodeoxyribonuclease VII large subunit [Bacteroidaceae bacterium]|nr:exodeoxyribonuclease VII large subunit [Bacteroidaceae bacterium]
MERNLFQTSLDTTPLPHSEGQGEESVHSFTLLSLNRLVRTAIEQTLDGEYWLEAELSEARLASNGHFYVEFVQKDDSGRTLVAKARGVAWARTYNMIAPLFERATGERLRAGLKVRVLVGVEFHELYGYSLTILSIDPGYTLGDMAARRREILQRLEADGILHDNQQLPLPTLLQRIAVVSSASAAGYGDFCDQLQNNDYGLHFHVQLFPAVMQGANVEESVLAALAAICDEADRWDCVVIIRGGGATSDLSDFDTYTLAAAVTQMPLPVIVGIGHERDETVLDYVAHTRVKTPTAAAAFLVDYQAQQLVRLEELNRRIFQSTSQRLLRARARLDQLTTTLPRTFVLITERQRHRLDLIQQRQRAALQRQLERERHRHELLRQRLETLSPERQLRRGYSLTFADGRLLRSAADLPPGTLLTTRLADGEITSTTSAKT